MIWMGNIRFLQKDIDIDVFRWWHVKCFLALFLKKTQKQQYTPNFVYFTIFFKAYLFRRWLNYRWTLMPWGLRRTWGTFCWWRLKRRSTGCMTTGTASTLQSRPLLETTSSSPASSGWWVTTKWCCGTEEVHMGSFGDVCRTERRPPLCDQWCYAVKALSLHSVALRLLQHSCLRMIRPAWSSGTDKKSWKRGGKPTGKLTLRVQVCGCVLQQAEAARPLLCSPLQMEGVAAGLSYEHRC